MSITQNAGYRYLVVYNLIPYIDGNPENLRHINEFETLFGVNINQRLTANDGQYRKLNRLSNATPIVCAWGQLGRHAPWAFRQGLSYLQDIIIDNNPNQQFFCLGRTIGGHPKHASPRSVAPNTLLEPFNEFHDYLDTHIW